MSDGFGLACPECKHIFSMKITMGVVAAHMEVEHNITEVKLDLVVLCLRCDGIMPLERTEHTKSGPKHHHYCDRCKRSRIVNQRDMDEQ